MLGWLLVLTLAAPDGGPPAPSLTPNALRPLPGFAPPPPSPVSPRSYDLRRLDGGQYEYDGPTFKARIAADGSVRFTDRRVSTVVYLLPFLPQRHPPGTETLEGSLRNLLDGKRRARQVPPGPPPDRSLLPVPATPAISRDRRHWTYPITPLPLVQASGRMDLTDEIMRFLGNDPYRYEKAQFMASTYDMRLQMAVESRSRALRGAPERVTEQVEAIWADGGRSPGERRRVICALWAEVAGDSGAVAEAIERFVQRRLPAEGPDRYTDAELAACPTGAAGRRFTPYAGAGSEP
jgi:hypothetical protein